MTSTELSILQDAPKRGFLIAIGKPMNTIRVCSICGTRKQTPSDEDIAELLEEQKKLITRCYTCYLRERREDVLPYLNTSN